MVERCQLEELVLAIQDTTTLNYDGLKATIGLVGLGGLETGEEESLWEHVAALPRLTDKSVEIGACGGKRAQTTRTAKLKLRAARARLAPPREVKSREPIDTLAVSTTEPNPPAG